MNEQPRDQDREQQDEQEAPAARNPFAEDQDEDDRDEEALVQTKRSAALLGVVVGLGALILVVLICIFGSYAFVS